MNEKDLQYIRNLQGMLNCCIYRMCITGCKKELDKRYEDAKGYLQTIYIIAESVFDTQLKNK